MSPQLKTPRTVSAFVWDHPGIVLTLVYVYLSALGIAYGWNLYRQFGVNIMDFAEATDFLLAALKNAAWLLPMVTVAVSFGLGMSMSVLMLARPGVPFLSAASYTLARYPKLYILSAVLIVVSGFLYAFRTGLKDAERIRNGDWEEVAVQLGSGDDATVPACLDGELFLVGTTEKFAFFYDLAEDDALIIPISSVLHIRHLSEGSSWTCPTPSPTSILWEIEAPEGETRAAFTRDVLMGQSCTDCKMGELQRATMLRPGPEGCEQAAWDPGPEWKYCHVEVLNGDLAGTLAWVNANHLESR